jgi:hypothetical protein
MFGNAGGAKIRQFVKSTAPVRAWYNTTFFDSHGLPCKTYNDGIKVCEQDAQVTQIRYAAVRNLSSVIILTTRNTTKKPSSWL